MSTVAKVSCDVKDLALADGGKLRIEWADQFMPALGSIRQRFATEPPVGEPSQDPRLPEDESVRPAKDDVEVEFGQIQIAVVRRSAHFEVLRYLQSEVSDFQVYLPTAGKHGYNSMIPARD